MTESTVSYPTIHLNPGEADRIVAGHPWVYAGEIDRIPEGLEDGTVVSVKDSRRRFVGIGFFNSKSKIQVRMIGLEREEVNELFFEVRIRQALAVRQRHMPAATSYRVVNAESDFLSGLIVDKYEDNLVVQFTSLGMDYRKQQIAGALRRIFSPKAIFERSDLASRKFEGLGPSGGVLYSADPDQTNSTITIRINGLAFQVDVAAGHKTGLYLDQQVNYQKVAALAARYTRGAALDCFSFLGGFALHLAGAGFHRVTGVDQSAEANAAATKNAALNGFEKTCAFETANVFDLLKARTAVKEGHRVEPAYDVIVLDPPSFTRNRAAVPDALRGYKEIHLRALKLLKPGGLLATFCCSHHVHAPLFQESIMAAAYDAHKTLRRVDSFAQSPDHPIIPAIPETEYLKGFAYELVR